MKVVVASSGLGHVSRGIEAWAADLGSALFRRGIDVKLCKGGGRTEAPYERIIPCWQRGSIHAERVARLLPRSMAWRLGLGSAYGVEQTTFAWNLVKYLRAERVDLLHVQDPQLALIVQRARRVGLVGTRTILAHGTEEPVSFLKKITYVQHLAPWHEEECKADGVWKPAWTAVPNFIDTGRFRPGDGQAMRTELGIPADALVVLSVAAIKRAHKRIDVLLEALAGLRASEPTLPVWLVVAGGQETETNEVVALGRRLLGDRVRFLVRFPRERMPELYRSANVLILSSLKEMMPIALLEAAASGLPCIVNRHPVLEWMVGPGGVVIDMAEPEAIKEATRDILQDARRRRKLGRAAREHCLRNFGEEAVVSRVLDYYHSVLGRRVRTEACPPAPLVRRRHSVSVVIPTYNAGPWIAQAVESVLAQTIHPAEIIVVDDGSTDDTRQRLAPYLDRIRCIGQANQGVAVARNQGISRSSGDLIAFLDADDVWHPRKLELQLKAMADNPAVGLLGTGTFDWPGQHIPEVDSKVCRSVVVPWRRLAVKNAMTTSSVLVRREILESVGGFDPELRGPEDYDLWLRIAEAGPVANLNMPLVGYRVVQGSLGQRAAAMEAGLRRIHVKLDGRGAWRGDWLLRQRARGYCCYSCAYLHAAEGNQRKALSRIVRSLATYPLPFGTSEVRFALGRLRMLTMILRGLPGSKRKPRTDHGRQHSMNTISIKLRQAQGPFWSGCKRIACRVLAVHVPVSSLTRPVFKLFFNIHVLVREGVAWGLRFFWYEPLFRSQCVSVGEGFRMEQLPYIVGRGRITIGRRVRLSGKSSFGFGDRFGRDPSISIGDGTFVGHNCGFGIADSISIGRQCLLARGVSIRDYDGHPLDAGDRRANRPPPPEGIKPVVIGDDVWIGAGAMILKGVTIGDRAVVGAGAVVTRDVPEGAIVAGNPARTIRRDVSKSGAVPRRKRAA